MLRINEANTVPKCFKITFFPLPARDQVNFQMFWFWASFQTVDSIYSWNYFGIRNFFAQLIILKMFWGTYRPRKNDEKSYYHELRWEQHGVICSAIAFQVCFFPRVCLPPEQMTEFWPIALSSCLGNVVPIAPQVKDHGDFQQLAKA